MPPLPASCRNTLPMGHGFSIFSKFSYIVPSRCTQGIRSRVLLIGSFRRSNKKSQLAYCQSESRQGFPTVCSFCLIKARICYPKISCQKLCCTYLQFQTKFNVRSWPSIIQQQNQRQFLCHLTFFCVVNVMVTKISGTVSHITVNLEGIECKVIFYMRKFSSCK